MGQSESSRSRSHSRKSRSPQTQNGFNNTGLSRSEEKSRFDEEMAHLNMVPEHQKFGKAKNVKKLEPLQDIRFGGFENHRYADCILTEKNAQKHSYAEKNFGYYEVRENIGFETDFAKRANENNKRYLNSEFQNSVGIVKKLRKMGR